MKHTQGPWIVRIKPYPEENDKHWIDSENGLTPIANVFDYFADDEGSTGRANAKLIAAAPSMEIAIRAMIVNINLSLKSGCDEYLKLDIEAGEEILVKIEGK